MAALLEANNVEAFYGPTRVLKGISFEVAEGGITTILGANGAGKTSTLRAISGLVRRTGEIRFAGQRVDGYTTEKIAALGIAHVPDGRGTLVNMTVEENLRVGAYLRRSKKEVEEGMERMFGYFPRLRERRQQQAGTLSGGEQQMLAISRALMARPTLLLLDEPSMGLSPILVETIFRIIQDINRQGTTILLVEQNARMALRVAHRGYVIQTGRIVLHDAAAELLRSDLVRKSYLGEK